EEKNEEDRSKFDDPRESPISVRNLDELIDENHVIVSSSVRTKYYVTILSFHETCVRHRTNAEGLMTYYLSFHRMFYNQRPTSTVVLILFCLYQSCIYLFILQKVVTVKPCLWNGMKRLCYLFARKFYPEALHNLMQFSNYTLIRDTSA
ncbi:unnamed protein product, partial [Musa banksii]